MLKVFAAIGATVALLTGGYVASSAVGEGASVLAAGTYVVPPPSTVTNSSTVTETVTQTVTAPPVTTTQPPTTTTQPPAGTIQPGQFWQTAYDNAAAGSVLTVAAGNHGKPTLAGNKAVTFKGQPGAVVNSMPGSAANVTFEGITVDTGSEHGYKQASEITAANITWKNVDVKGLYASVQTFGGATGFKWLGGVFDAPGQRSNSTGDGEPLWLGAHIATIDGVTFKAFNSANDAFHLEDIRIQGVNDVSILNVTFTAGSDAGSGHIFVTNSSPSTNVVKRLRIENTIFPPVIGTYAIQFHANVQRYDSYVYKNNRFDQGILDQGSYVNLIACGNTGDVPASWKTSCP